MKTKNELTDQAINLLKKLISIPSYSTNEEDSATLLFKEIESYGFQPIRVMNNVFVWAKDKDPSKPTLLLNSHHDTVKATNKWTVNPFEPLFRGDKIFGLGSNDAGGSLVSLLAAFIFLSQIELPYNLVFLASSEEEISGKNGMPSILPLLEPIDLAIVGEPTQMKMATAERGLLVVDCTSHGISGHAARSEGDNAIYKAIEDLKWFQNFQFSKISNVLGKVNMTVTMIEAGEQHNVVPDTCRFVVDVRPNEHYTNVEILEIIKMNTECDVIPRSINLNASSISEHHPVVVKAKSLNISTFGSKTMSDQVHLKCNSVKIGPGDSRRSHTADEYIFLKEIQDGIKTYIELLQHLVL